jgi:tetratricopeptide (TPR) repeat protein
MPSKEKLLLGIVVAAVAGVSALDRKYVNVPVPATKAPSNVPEAPPGPEPFTRWQPVRGRAMHDPYSDLVSPPLVELPDLPSPPVPIAAPPVRPWLLMDAVSGQRHFFFDPAETPVKETEEDAAAPMNGGAAAGGGFLAEPGADEKVEEKPAKKEEEKVDLSLFDWVKTRDGLGQISYGKITLLPQDREKRTRFDLLVDENLDFTFWQVNSKDGKPIGGPVAFRSRTEQLGFADTFENNYGSKRARLEAAAGRKSLDTPVLHELVGWCMEEAKKPKYPRRQCWTAAEKDLREIFLRAPDDKDALKELGRTLRLLQDLEAEAELYDWWLSRQTISKDPEILAIMGDALEMLGLRDRARMRYEESLVTGTDPRVRVKLGDLLLATGSLEDARRAVDLFRRAAQDGERGSGAVGEARALLATGDLEGADAALAKASGSEKDGAWYNAAGAVLYARGDFGKAREHFQAARDKARSGDDSFAIARTNLAMVMARQAALLAETDAARGTALAEAIKTAEDALADDPLNYYWPLVARAYAERASGAREKAVETMQEAVAAYPLEPYGRYLLGEFLLRDGRKAEARTQFLESVRLSPRFPDGLGGVGRSGGGAAGESADYLHRAMELEPKTALWPFLAARMAFFDEGLPLPQRLEDANQTLRRLLDKVERSHPFAQAVLGWVRYYQGDPNEALDRWNTALRLIAGFHPSSPREAQMAEDLGVWLRDAIARVDKWMRTKIWPEEFNRPDGPNVGGGWSEDEQPGVKLTLKDGAAQFGPGKFGAGITPALWTERDSAKVLKGSITVQVLPTEPVQVDVMFWKPQGKNIESMVGVRKTEAGDMRLLIRKDLRAKEAETVLDLPGVKWPEDGRVTFGFTKMNEEKGIISLQLNGKTIAGYEALEIQNLGKSRGGKIRVEVRCTAQSGTEVNARVEAVELWLDTQ